MKNISKTADDKNTKRGKWSYRPFFSAFDLDSIPNTDYTAICFFPISNDATGTDFRKVFVLSASNILLIFDRSLPA